MSDIEASIFFFKWSKTALDTYTSTIKSNYFKLLVEHCTKARANDEESSKMFDIDELGADPRVVKDDREDIKRRLKDAQKQIYLKEEIVKTKKPVSLGELATLYRLKTLLKMCEKLIEIMARMVKWMDENKALLRKFSESIKIFPFCRKMFEAVCAVGEIFQLKSIEWQSCKYAKMLDPSKTDYSCKLNAELQILEAKVYCPQFMTMVNYFRTVVYIMGCSFTGMLETIFLKISHERCEIRSREINSILKLLPPQFLFTKDYAKLSRRTSMLLEIPPKNERSFPMVSERPILDASSTRKSSKSKSKKDSHKSESKKSKKRIKSQKTSQKSGHEKRRCFREE
ncbi:unnamed protein product [Caenorhabditis angaria]|uniref:Uncharacterized protein n=1 Tax=Caenorhabditis angaria TaxID=860376 RepID=A0A9P1IUI6_9PELO|nr:unnamed protein product [Caenorhabditis angaria]